MDKEQIKRMVECRLCEGCEVRDINLAALKEQADMLTRALEEADAAYADDAKRSRIISEALTKARAGGV